MQTLHCDFCGREHANGNCTVGVESEEVHNANFQKNYLYSNTYNPVWKDHHNFKWNNNQNFNSNQGV